MVVVGAGDVAGAAGPGAAAIERRVHRGDDGRVLAHPEIVVRAPHRDLAALAVAVKGGEREPARPPLQIGKNPVVAAPPQPIELFTKKRVIIHGRLRSVPKPPSGLGNMEEMKLPLGSARGGNRAGRECGAQPLLVNLAADRNDAGLLALACGERRHARTPAGHIKMDPAGAGARDPLDPLDTPERAARHCFQHAPQAVDIARSGETRAPRRKPQLGGVMVMTGLRLGDGDACTPAGSRSSAPGSATP